MKTKMVKLGDIATIYNGNSINKNVKKEKYTKNVPGWNYIGTKDIDYDGSITYNNGVIIPYSETGFKIAPAGSVFVCSEGGSAGKKTALVKEDVCFGNKLFAIVNDKGLFQEKYVFFYTRYSKFSEQFKRLATSLMGGISSKNFATIEIPLVEIEEQKRIVNKIEELFSELDSAIETLKKTKEQLAVYRQSVLSTAIGQSEECCQMHIEELLVKNRKGMTTGPFGTMIKKSDHRTSGHPMLGIENIGRGKFCDGNKIFVTDEKAKELEKYRVKRGDVIISRSGTVGEICEIPQRAENALISTNLIRISLDENVVLSQYFIYLFQTQGSVLKQVKELCKGSTRPFLTQGILKDIIFPIPTIKKQRQIISQIESQLTLSENIEKTINDALIQAEAMRQSILKKAFEGEL